MLKRKPIILHGKEDERIITQPFRPTPPQFHEELSDHLQHLRSNGKIVDVDPNCERVEARSNIVLKRNRYKPSMKTRISRDAKENK